ncbi:MAG: hypothetical protein BGO98_16945 [Myxococcales bacterium 68-20]|nr:MAG: hypothetical protein BGO98_16945 [Myxococcales bacterium 68-20]
MFVLLDNRYRPSRDRALPSLRERKRGGATPADIILLGWDDTGVSSIRDFRYVPYIAREAELEVLDGTATRGSAT